MNHRELLKEWFPVVFVFAVFVFARATSINNIDSHVLARVNYGKVKDINRISSCKKNLRNIATAVKAYISEHGRPPSSIKILIPRYLQKMPTCPAALKSTYILTTKPNNHFIIYCSGKNHTECPHSYPRYDSKKGIEVSPGKIVSPP